MEHVCNLKRAKEKKSVEPSLLFFCPAYNGFSLLLTLQLMLKQEKILSILHIIQTLVKALHI